MSVRAFWRAVKVDSQEPPYDTIHLKVFYPGQVSASEPESNFGVVPAATEQAPFLVVIFFSGANCDALMYQWLAIELVERGLVVVTFNWVAQNPTRSISLTPGVNMAMWKPDAYGTGSSASALPSLLAELERLQSEGILAGMLDLQRIVLGGHSAGGRLALENADPRFFPQVAGAFAYGTSSAAFVNLGYTPDTILPLPGLRPLLLMGGSCDGVLAYITQKWNRISPGDATTAIKRTFKQALSGGRDDTYLVIWEGANHFSIAELLDLTTRSSIDLPATQPESQIRSLMAEAIGLFIDAHIRQKPEASQKLNQLLNSGNPLIASSERK